MLLRYLNQVHHVDFPPDQFWHCTCAMTAFMSASMCSTYLTISMTFERFYSIIQPHKAASFNTVKRAKKTISCTVVSSITFSIPHVFITAVSGKGCIPYLGGLKATYGLLYYWISLIVHFIFPFISLLVMSSVIIHTLRNRTIIRPRADQGQVQGQNESHQPKMGSSERHIFVTLLLVTFAFLILSTPSYVFLFLMIDTTKRTPISTAIFHLFLQVAGNMHYTNSGINFFLYVLSGRKFRADLLRLFQSKNSGHQANASASSSSAQGTNLTMWRISDSLRLLVCTLTFFLDQKVFTLSANLSHTRVKGTSA